MNDDFKNVCFPKTYILETNALPTALVVDNSGISISKKPLELDLDSMQLTWQN